MLSALSSSLLRPSSQKLRAYLVILSVVGTTVLNSYVRGALTVALPTIGDDLRLSSSQLQWPISALSLANGALLLLCGGLADAFGRKQTYLIGALATCAVSVGTAFASNGLVFIILCAALGATSAILTPASVGMLGAFFPDGPFRNRSFAALGAGQPCGFVLGLLAGGLLAEKWQIVFFIMSGLSLLCVLLGWTALPGDDEMLSLASNGPGNTSQPLSELALKPRRALSSFDWLGSLLSTSGLVLLTFALADAESSPNGWSTPYIPALLPVSILLLAVFQVWQQYLEKMSLRKEAGLSARKRPPEPLLPPSIWKAPAFAPMIATVFCAWLTFQTLTFYNTLMLQEVQKVTPIHTAVYFLPQVFVGLILFTVAGMLVGRLSAIWLILFGGVGGCLSCGIYLTVNQDTAYYRGMLWVFILVVSTDLCFPAAQIFACKTVGRSRSALAGSLFNTTVRISTSFGLAICAAIQEAVTKSYSKAKNLSENTPEALLKGYRAAVWTLFAFSAASTLFALLFLRDIGIVGGKDPEYAEEGQGETQSREEHLPRQQDVKGKRHGELCRNRDLFEDGKARLDMESDLRDPIGLVEALELKVIPSHCSRERVEK